MTMSKLLFVICSVDTFHVNFNLSIIVFCAFISNTLIMARPDISSINDASTFINFCSLGFKTMHSLGKIGINLFKKLKQQSLELVMPFNSNMFLIPKLCLHSHVFLILTYISQICACVYLLLLVL